MAIRVALHHRTFHSYARDVWLSPQVVRLRPAPHCRTPILSYSLKVTPAEHFINWQQDPYSNYQARLVFPTKTREFCVEVDLIAELAVINPFDFFMEASAEHYPFEYEAVLKRELSPYFETLAVSPKFASLILETKRAKSTTPYRTIDYLVELNSRVQSLVKYTIRLEPGIQTPEETLTCLSGSCRDSAWLMVQLLRHHGIAARFVSGYLIQLTPDVKSLDGPSGATSDFTDLHAWVEAYVPGAGWIGLDPTSGLLASEGHIPLAATAEPSSAAAITGFFSYEEDVTKQDPEAGAVPYDGKDDTFEFAMTVKRVHEDPRVTKPYTEETWEEIKQAGREVDAALNKGEVRLTMGGEPTFVSIDDFDAPEWNAEAVGEHKYERCDKLVRRLKDRFGPGGFLHHGQGKWYPGEQLPRWAMGLYWRKDGQPIWLDKNLVADEFNITRPVTSADAEAFIKHLAEVLEVEPGHVLPGHEDAWYYMWKERRLPTNVDPFENKLADELERARMARIFETGLEKVVGYCLPLRRRYFTDGTADWFSGNWFFRPERMYLVPGDSAMGLRLPLDSIPWVAPGEFPHIYERDPMEARQALPDRERFARQRHLAAAVAAVPGGLGGLGGVGLAEQFLGDDEDVRRPRAEADAWGKDGVGGSGGVGVKRKSRDNRREVPDEVVEYDNDYRRSALPPARGQSAPWIVRTALCTEVRNGVLRVFFPPVRYIEDYLDLISAVEQTADDLGIPVLCEGYTPPQDSRIELIKVTPDPGVIEVNTHPAKSWDELVTNIEGFYEEARLTRLCAEKFMHDGKHVGTGGGNHIVFGGQTPADSPLLRRPDLLKSMLGYWQNHPSLSYLFSGLHIGPTSQAPRVDEARNDQVYEMELAFAQVPKKGEGGLAPWLVDRIFRNLLVDSTGNTHRAEFCIDKLYAPESATGRLGLLEMRGFEMPPHPRMSLAQHLLLRALIAKFWHEPYEIAPVRWRSEIHDRFLLPHFVEQDLTDVIDDLNASGLHLKTEWYVPQLEFRFPHVGQIEHRGVVLEVRQAIEPWHVLGEQPGANSTVRFVDSSVERVQVLVKGMTDTRHLVACNGVEVPLHPTGVNGEFVAGVRFKAWQPSESLHPTIRKHAPLTFDVVDTWNNRSVGGCRYTVAHPGGRSFEVSPVNSFEAESRRQSRFQKFGHTPGLMNVVKSSPTKEYPLTLDLRRFWR